MVKFKWTVEPSESSMFHYHGWSLWSRLPKYKRKNSTI